MAWSWQSQLRNSDCGHRALGWLEGMVGNFADTTGTHLHWPAENSCKSLVLGDDNNQSLGARLLASAAGIPKAGCKPPLEGDPVENPFHAAKWARLEGRGDSTSTWNLEPWFFCLSAKVVRCEAETLSLGSSSGARDRPLVVNVIPSQVSDAGWCQWQCQWR